MQEAEYYVYVYLDPRKQGYYQYGSTSFEYEPFYVGKGKGARKSQHLFESSLSRGSAGPKVAKIRKLVSLGLEPIIVTPFENLSESVAYAKEDEMITLIGSPFIDNIEDGPLVNMLLGANPPNHKGKSYVEIYGSVERAESEKRKRREKLEPKGFFDKTGIRLSDETKRKIGEKSKLSQKDGGHRTGILHTAETIQRFSEVRKVAFKRSRVMWTIVNIDTGDTIETPNLKVTCEEMNLSKSTIEKSLHTRKPANRGKTKGWLALTCRPVTGDEWDAYQKSRLPNDPTSISCSTAPIT